MKLLHFWVAVFLHLSRLGLAGDEPLRVRWLYDPQGLDWNIAGSQTTSFVFQNIMRGLFVIDENMHLKKDLAESFEHSADYRNFSVKILSGLRWSSGKPLEAVDFLRSWKRLLDPLEKKTMAFLLFDVEGAQEYHEGKLKKFDQVGIRTVGNKIFFRLKKPNPAFLKTFSVPNTFPLKEADFDLKRIQVLGPFLPKNYERGKTLYLRRNPFHPSTRSFPDVSLHFIDDDQKAVDLLNEDRMDVVFNLNYGQALEMRKDKRFHSSPLVRVRYLFFNTKRFPFNLNSVRKAVALGLDREALLPDLEKVHRWTSTIVPSALLAGSESKGLKTNVKAARALIKESGLDLPSMRSMDIAALNTNENASIVYALSNQLKRNLDVSVHVRLLEKEAFQQAVTLQTSSIYYFGKGADYPDVYSLLNAFLSYSGFNTMQWKHEAYDALVEKAKSTIDDQGRERIYAEALSVLIEKEVPIIPLFFERMNFLIKETWENVMVLPTMGVPLLNLRRRP